MSEIRYEDLRGGERVYGHVDGEWLPGVIKAIGLGIDFRWILPGGKQASQIRADAVDRFRLRETWTLDELATNQKLGLSRGTLTKAFEFGLLKKHRGRLEATRPSLDRYLARIGIKSSSVLDEGEAVG